jgi:hypothetical protein
MNNELLVLLIIGISLTLFGLFAVFIGFKFSKKEKSLK